MKKELLSSANGFGITVTRRQKKKREAAAVRIRHKSLRSLNKNERERERPKKGAGAKEAKSTCRLDVCAACFFFRSLARAALCGRLSFRPGLCFLRELSDVEITMPSAIERCI